MRSCGKVAGDMQVTGEQVTWAGDFEEQVTGMACGHMDC